jgi:hypothetical protein
VRDFARLLRLAVYCLVASGFYHMPKVWLRNPDTCRPLNQPCSAPLDESSGRNEVDAAVAGSTEVDAAVAGRSEAEAPVTLSASPDVTVRSAADAREPNEKTKAKASSAADPAIPPPRTPTVGNLVPMSFLL